MLVQGDPGQSRAMRLLPFAAAVLTLKCHVSIDCEHLECGFDQAW